MGGNIQPMQEVRAGDGGKSGFSTKFDTIMAHWSRDGRQISKPLKVTFFCFFALTVVALTSQDLIGDYKSLNQRLNTTVETAKAFLLHQEKVGASGLEKALMALSTNQNLISAFTGEDPYALQKMTSSLFPEMEQRHRITEFTIFDVNLRRVIDAHQSAIDTRENKSHLVELAAQTDTITSGFELGDDGTTVVSAVRPWKSGGRLIGFIKLGIEIRSPLQFIGQTLNANVIEVHEVDSLMPGTAPAAGRKGWVLTDTVAYRKVDDFELPNAIEVILREKPAAIANTNQFITMGNRVKIAYSVPLSYSDGSLSASLILLQDITSEVATSMRHVGTSIFLACIIAAAAGSVVYRLIQSLQTSVVATRRKLEFEVEKNIRAFHQSQERLLEAQKIASVGSWERDLTSDELFWSDEMYRITGLPLSFPVRSARQRLYQLIPAHERSFVAMQMDLAVSACREFNFEHSLVRPDGTLRRVQVRGYALSGPDGRAAKVLGTTHDITERHNAQERSKRLAGILEASINEIYVFDTDTLVCQHANKCARENLGYSMAELCSLPVWTIAPGMNEDVFREHLKPLFDGQVSVLSMERMHRRKDGTEYPVEARFQLHKEPSRSLLVSICHDVSERTARERETQAARQAAERIAYFDELTKLPNRAACMRDARDLFAGNKEEKPAFIIHLDIDNFKRVNDTLGHGAGDACLEEAGERLKMCCTGLGTAYRWGGDEFVIIADNSTSDAEELCERVNLVMRAPMEFDGNQIWPSASIGVSRCPDDGHDFSALLVHADLALYRSKEDGKDRWNFFTSDMKIDSDEEARTEKELREALRRDEFFLVFQPQVNIRTQQVTGVEALVRWRHPSRGVLAPGSFLPVVEKTNLATPLGQAVIDKALQAARSWTNAKLDFGRIAVNLSPSHLTSGTLVSDFTSAMDRYGVPPGAVTAEVLESVFLDNQRTNNSEILETLHNLGMHIELDDFGTGYASLSHVADLPINGLKIDRSFTAQILSDRKKEIVVNHLIHLARALDINVVCEGVETESQHERLRMMGNFSVQGYYISRPMDFDAMQNWLECSQGELSFKAV